MEISSSKSLISNEKIIFRNQQTTLILFVMGRRKIKTQVDKKTSQVEIDNALYELVNERRRLSVPDVTMGAFVNMLLAEHYHKFSGSCELEGDTHASVVRAILYQCIADDRLVKAVFNDM